MGNERISKDGYQLSGLLGAMPERPKSFVKTRLETLKPVDLGEPIVGSRHRLSIGAPKNLDDRPAQVFARSEGAVDLDVTWNSIIAPHAIAEPISVTIAPTAKGPITGEVHVTAHWDDGHVEHQYVAVLASARELTDAPKDHETTPTSAVREPSSNRQASIDGLDQSLTLLLNKQIEGVNVVYEEQKKYVAPPPEKSLWWDLAELALVMGTAGVGSLLGRLVEQGVGKMLANRTLESAAAEEVAGEATGAGLGAAVEDGFKHVAERATKGAAEPSESGAHEHEGETEAQVASKDATINFFSTQRSMLMDTYFDLADPLRAQLKPFATDARSSGLVLEATRTAIRAISDTATEVQKSATAQQYAAYRARGSLGTEQVETKHGRVAVTKLDAARTSEHGKLGSPDAYTGLLDIAVRVDGDRVVVEGPRIDGVSRLVADRLLEADLVAARIPLRISTSEGWITRDEVGRVRYSGFGSLDPDRMAGLQGRDERQQLLGAQHLVDLVLAKSLKQWELKRVDTDDASKP